MGSALIPVTCFVSKGYLCLKELQAMEHTCMRVRAHTHVEKRSSILKVTPQMVLVAMAGSGQRQEPRAKGPRPSAVFCCFSLLSPGSSVGYRAVGT